jgi:acetylornithine deacetylase/succinyl-diaminopimelate desuccinylase-like protein
VTPGSTAAVRAELEGLMAELARDAGVRVEMQFDLAGDAFAIPADAAVVQALQAARTALGEDHLPPGGKPFVDDGNTFASVARIPALTHGPAGRGAHTLEESVPVAELVRVARTYAVAAAAYCAG